MIDFQVPGNKYLNIYIQDLLEWFNQPAVTRVKVETYMFLWLYVIDLDSSYISEFRASNALL